MHRNVKSSFRITVGQHVRKLRVKAGLTMTDLADKIGDNLVQKSTIQRWESGQISPTLEQFFRIFAILGQDPNSFFFEVAPELKQRFFEKDTSNFPFRKKFGEFEVRGRVEAVLVAATNGSVVSRTQGMPSHVTVPVPKIQVIRGHGVRGDSHAGARLADVREKDLLAFGLHKGTEISNQREFSAVSAEELAQIASTMNIPSGIPMGCLGENLILSGIPRLTELPIGTKLFFRKDEQTIRTAVLIVCGENLPCELPSKAIEIMLSHPQPDHATSFPKAAIGKRGVVGSVYVSGHIHSGDTVVVKVPHQRFYDPTQP